MKIEAVMVSINYGDFLKETLPYTIPHVDNLVVVSSKEDLLTQQVCRKWGVKCLLTEVHQRDSQFNKSRAINHGLNHLTRHDWLLHLDADVVLPPTFRRLLDNAELQEDCIYGVDRANCPFPSPEWEKYKREYNSKTDVAWFVYPPFGLPIGSRLVHGDYGGYVPIGYFQLWHSDQRIRYPITLQSTAEHTDLLHGVEWSRPKRVLLPEVIVVHLASPGARMGANWGGRKTPIVESPLEEPESSKSLERHHKHHHHHHHHHHDPCSCPSGDVE